MVLHNGSHTEHGLFIWIFYGFEAKLLTEVNRKVVTEILFTQQNLSIKNPFLERLMFPCAVAIAVLCSSWL